MNVAQPVVVSDPLMTQPGAILSATLVAHAAAKLGEIGIVGNDHSALAGGHLLVGIEGETGQVAERTRLLSAIGSADGLAGILDDLEVILAGDFANGLHVARQAKNVNRQDSLHFPARLAIDHKAPLVAPAALGQKFPDP